ncbi:MAG: hypothetical protein HY318_11520 [Armatimonadetes bacterium]|nr:hypothetical protein [Armatimonadota bacterium]
MAGEVDLAQLEEQLAEARARRFMAEREAAAVDRASGLSREPRKLDKEMANSEARVSKLRAREAELEAKIHTLKVAPSVEEPSSQDSTTDIPETGEAERSPSNETS